MYCPNCGCYVELIEDNKYQCTLCNMFMCFDDILVRCDVCDEKLPQSDFMLLEIKHQLFILGLVVEVDKYINLAVCKDCY